MELLLPATWPISIEMLALAVSFLLGAGWAAASAYRRIMAELHAMREDIDAMKSRNLAADRETSKVKLEQSEQRTTVAVMAERIEGLGRTIDRMDRGISELLKASRDKPK